MLRSFWLGVVSILDFANVLGYAYPDEDSQADAKDQNSPAL